MGNYICDYVIVPNLVLICPRTQSESRLNRWMLDNPSFQYNTENSK